MSKFFTNQRWEVEVFQLTSKSEENFIHSLYESMKEIVESKKIKYDFYSSFNNFQSFLERHDFVIVSTYRDKKIGKIVAFNISTIKEFKKFNLIIGGLSVKHQDSKARQTQVYMTLASSSFIFTKLIMTKKDNYISSFGNSITSFKKIESLCNEFFYPFSGQGRFIDERRKSEIIGFTFEEYAKLAFPQAKLIHPNIVEIKNKKEHGFLEENKEQSLDAEKVMILKSHLKDLEEEDLIAFGRMGFFHCVITLIKIKFASLLMARRG